MHQYHSSNLNSLKQINFDMLIRGLDVLAELADSASIVVEGKRDAETLRALGIGAKFYFISSSRGTIWELAEELAEQGKEVIILTDFDSKGTQLASKLISALHNAGKKVKINTKVRRDLMRAFNGRKIGEIEDLKSLIPAIKGDINGKNWNSRNKIHHTREIDSNRRCGKT